MYPTGISPGRSAFNTVKFINRAKNIDCRDIFLPLPRFAFLSPDDDEILSKQNLPRSYPVDETRFFSERKPVCVSPREENPAPRVYRVKRTKVSYRVPHIGFLKERSLVKKRRR